MTLGVVTPASAIGDGSSILDERTSTRMVSAGNVLDVTQDAAGTITINQGSVLSASQVVKVKIDSKFAAGDVEIFQIHNVSGTLLQQLQQVDTQIVAAGQGGAVAQAAMHWFTGTWEVPRTAIPAKTTFYGGRPFVGVNRFDRTFAPGTYIITQLRPSGGIKPSTVYKTFTVVGTQSVQIPVVDGTVSVVNTNGPDTFAAYSSAGSSKLRNGPVKFTQRTGGITNRTRELHFFDFKSVPAGTTKEQACDLVASQGPGNAASFGTMSTQQVANGYLNVTPGTYFITSWIPDVNSGTPHALEDNDADTPGIQCDGIVVEVVA